MFVFLLKRTLFLSGLYASSSLAFSSDHGCTVLLCLSNPAGWSSVSECAPPVKKLFRDLAKGHSFPGCDLKSASANADNYAKIVHKPYDDCPMGTISGPKGVLIAEGQKISSNKIQITGPEYISEFYEERTPKACVTQKLGNITKCTGGGKDRDPTCTTTAVYEKVIWLQPQKPRAIEVVVDGKLVNTVRF